MFGSSLLLAAFELWAHPAAFHEHAEPEVVYSAWESAKNYLWLGFVHIVPRGVDHVLFVLGLFFAGPKLKALLWQLTSFTLAHSLTLALATLGWLRLPPSIVEPLIALSIAYVALENVMFGAAGAHRPAIVFAFGLLHGLGFADALGEVGLPPAQFLLALVAFNVGVELGQLCVIVAAALAFGWWLKKSWYVPWVAKPASAVIALFGLYWLVERVFT